MKALLIDDDELIRKAHLQLIKTHWPNITSIEEATGVANGIEALARCAPVIVFLDVEMQDGAGFDFLSSVEHSGFQVVFVTAHEGYALRTFKFSATDFLLKPIASDELILAVERAEKRASKEQISEQIKILQDSMARGLDHQKKIVLRDQDSLYFIKIADITVLDAAASYTKFHVIDGKSILVSKTIKEYEELLIPHGFVRVHHSHIVNAHRIVRFDRTGAGIVITDDGRETPVSFRKREHLLAVLAKLG